MRNGAVRSDGAETAGRPPIPAEARSIRLRPRRWRARSTLGLACWRRGIGKPTLRDCPISPVAYLIRFFEWRERTGPALTQKKDIHPYDKPAGGWGALKAVGEHLVEQDIAIKGARTLLRMNQPTGFDCPGCAWPDPKHTSSFEFCENGAKAVAWEATARRCGPEFFAAHTVRELSSWTDYELEMAGRLTHPMTYDPATDRYVPVSWDEAFATVGRHLAELPDPNMAEFYTSGRTSNEAAFLYQLLARAFGTNNFPDCSNMCHEATSVGLPRSIGVGKGTVLLEDFDRTDCILIFGQNPGTNSPRMMTSLRDAARRGATILSFNPFRERALQRFQAPQSPIEMATLTSTRISSRLHQVRVGGDMAVVKGLMKAMVAADSLAQAERRAEVLDWGFIHGHTIGIDALIADLEATRWADIEARSGLREADIRAAAEAYAAADRAIVVYGMGITQHRRGASNVQQLANLCLLRGNLGKEGAGLCPVRGHSNVQGDRTVGITHVLPWIVEYDAVVVAVDYRLAPEHKAPAGCDDAYTAYLWALQNAAALGADPARVAVGGDSAGGNLSALVTQRARDDRAPLPALQVLIYPGTNAAAQTRSMTLFANGFFLTRRDIEWFKATHLDGTGIGADDARVSPMHADDLSGLSPALIITAGFDPLRDEGRQYADALRAAGTPVDYREYGTVVHGFANFFALGGDSATATADFISAIRAHLTRVG